MKTKYGRHECARRGAFVTGRVEPNVFTRTCTEATRAHAYLRKHKCSSPGVEVSMARPHSSSVTSSATFLQAQFGEDAHQHHDGHHATDDVDDEVRAVPLLVALALGDGGHGLARVGPDGRVVVGADALVQPLLTELAAKAVETGSTAVEKDPGVAVERWVPLAHHVVVTLATRPANRGVVLIVCIPATDGSGQTRLRGSVLGGVFVAGGGLVGRDDDLVSLGYCGDGWVLGEGRTGD